MCPRSVSFLGKRWAGKKSNRRGISFRATQTPTATWSLIRGSSGRCCCARVLDFLQEIGQGKAVLRIRDPGLGAFLTPGSGIWDGRKSATGSGIRDEQPGSYLLELRNQFFAFFGVKILKIFVEDPGSGMETVRIWDPGWKKVGSGIRDKHPGSATLGKGGQGKTQIGEESLSGQREPQQQRGL